jgi:chromosome segregation ATPase|tara:strand:+ start:28 stop:477 length:450 start_codon:yes stop_codon:yes gene_type:complete
MSLEELKTKVALLEQNADTGNIIHAKLEKSIEKLTELNASLKAMIIKQQAKLDKAEQIDEDIFITLESRRKEWDSDLKELHSRITTNTRELRDSQYHLESKLLNEIRMVRTQLSERVGVLEKWRWLIIGGSIIVGLLISNPDSMLMQLF